MKVYSWPLIILGALILEHVSSKLVVDSFYRPPNQGVSPILELESQLSEITDTFALGTTPKLLSFWAVILTQGVLSGKLD